MRQCHPLRGQVARDHGIVNKDVIRLETAAGIKIIRLLFEAGEVRGATVDMGEPVLAPDLIPVVLAPALTEAKIRSALSPGPWRWGDVHTR